MKLFQQLKYSLFVNTSIIFGLVLGLASTSVYADDTDIYVTGGGVAADEPLVMFVLDWRPNLSSTQCSGNNDAQLVTNCGYDATFVGTYLTAADKADNTITYFELLRAVLRQAMAPLDGIKVGFMINHDDNCNGNPSAGPTKTGCSNGAYVMQGFKSIDAADTNGNKAAFHTMLSSIPPPQGSASHKFQGKELYFELFRYLTGQGIYNGHLGWKDYDNTTSGDNLDGTGGPETPDYSALSWDTSIESLGTNYITPLSSSMVCSKIFVINIMFQVSQQEDDSDNAITDTKANGGMNSIVLSGASNNFDTVINWMFNNDIADGSIAMTTDAAGSKSNIDIDGKQNVISYFLVDSPNNTTNGYASAGGTGNAIELGTDPQEMADTITNIFNQILSVSTTFVSASVPVNVFNRAEFLDDVYMALFEAEENGFPSWIGNLKKLKLQTDVSGDLFIGDATGAPAFAADGRINFDALTYWTDPSGADVIAFDTTKGEISGADGRSVNRGGAGQKITGFLTGSVGNSNSDLNARLVYTEPATYTNGIPTNFMDLNATTTNASDLWPLMNAAGVTSSGAILNNTTWSVNATYAAATAAEKTIALDMLKWARGIDVMDQDIDGSTTDTRPWLLSDPIHSRPLTINYGITGAGYTATNPDVRIIMTGNDGFVHMFNNTDNAGVESGKEAWAFIPRYGLRLLNRLMTNTAGSPLHPYGVDGAPTIYTYDANGDGNLIASDSDKVYLFFGMRRGGRYYYAMDISDPEQPKILWSISDNDADFSELGLTFSKPQVVRVNYDGNTLKPALIFGGGYDTNKDARSNTSGSDDSRGNAIFIIDAEDGSLIWKATKGALSASATEFTHPNLDDSIPSDITAVDTNGNGAVDRFYVGDTGGNIWRGDINTIDRNDWKLQQFAQIGRHYNSSKNNDRRFFHAIDVVQSRDAVGAFDAVIVGSGDRANPLDTSVGANVPDNWFYMFKDRQTASGAVLSSIYDHDTVADLSDNCMQEFGLTCSGTQTTKLEAYGWKIKLEQAVGEKALSRPITLNGYIFFTSYKPPTGSGSGACGPDEGSGLTYTLNLQDATAVLNNNLSNSVSTPTGDVLILQAEDRYSDAGAGIPADVIAIRKNGGLHAITPGDNYTTPIDTNAGYKTFWYVEGD